MEFELTRTELLTEVAMDTLKGKLTENEIRKMIIDLSRSSNDYITNMFEGDKDKTIYNVRFVDHFKKEISQAKKLKKDIVIASTKDIIKQSGETHFVSFFINLKTNEIIVFDSAGNVDNSTFDNNAIMAGLDKLAKELNFKLDNITPKKDGIQIETDTFCQTHSTYYACVKNVHKFKKRVGGVTKLNIHKGRTIKTRMGQYPDQGKRDRVLYLGDVFRFLVKLINDRQDIIPKFIEGLNNDFEELANSDLKKYNQPLLKEGESGMGTLKEFFIDNFDESSFERIMDLDEDTTRVIV